MAVLAVTSLCLANSAIAAMQGSNPPQSAHAPPTTTASTAATNKGGTAKKGNLSGKDKKFMMNAAKGGMMEVEMGKQASQSGQNADVKKFGNRMVTDHGKANNELMGLAREEGVSLPSAKAPGKWKSDKDYMEDMVKDHEKDLTEFQNEAQNGTDPDVKAFASKGAQMVSKHLALAKQTQSKLK